ncbi:MAG: hypothetical protein XD73_0309 [Anaerolinea thermophila]|uniref:N-acetyltransferase domain-containing protein n=1 Tax=Anaerolinea thermophila TaxID=167964 RepID=A0A117LH24_9CHLR|nr:MAG: hypothetical protein XD73_0309 [Anaerolinea thermophila]
MERVFLQDVTKPTNDFLKNYFLSKDCLFSFHTLNPDQIGFAQIQIGGASGNLLYAFSDKIENYSLLIEDLCTTAGELGKTHILANVPGESEQFALLKRNGFISYSRQALWKISSLPSQDNGRTTWNMADNTDQTAIRSFYSKYISPLEISLQTWSFADTFHLIQQDHSGGIQGIARVRFYMDRAVVLPMLDIQTEDLSPWLTSLLGELSRHFSTIFVREPLRQDIYHDFLKEHAQVILPENHWLVRNLVNVSKVRELQPAEFRDERGIPRPTTPFTKS